MIATWLAIVIIPINIIKSQYYYFQYKLLLLFLLLLHLLWILTLLSPNLNSVNDYSFLVAISGF